MNLYKLTQAEKLTLARGRLEDIDRMVADTVGAERQMWIEERAEQAKLVAQVERGRA